jgi:hypothetical protein
MAVDRDGLDVVLRVFDDTRSLIAALKVQRWEVLKWGVTINIGLAAASAGFHHSPKAFVWFAILMAAFCLILILYYNLRMTRTRTRLTELHNYIRENVIDLKAATGQDYGKVKSTNYDKEELIIYTAITAASVLPTLFIVWSR